MSGQKDTRYWRENLRILKVMLAIWLVVSFFVSIIFAVPLDAIRLGGFGFGFWMAQQGSIFVYLILIFVYIRLVDKLDRKYGVDEQSLHASHREN